MLLRIEKHTGVKDLVSKVRLQKEATCINDFMSDYNAYGGNAYGLANTFVSNCSIKTQKSKIIKVKNLYYTGQLTVPGPGVPPSIISGKIV